jgi:tellurite resistance protein TerC
MNITGQTWIIAMSLLGVVFAFDFINARRRPREVKPLEAALWTIFYIMLALGFAIFLAQQVGAQASNEFLAGWLTEYSLSIDNLFVFIIIFRALKLPKEREQAALMAGIALALFFRAIFIGVGAFVIHKFVAIFFLFGAFLLYTAFHLGKGGGGDEDWHEGKVLGYFKRKGLSTFGLSIIALGITDVLFAVDSIPAIFGLTREAFIVFTANAFALLGLRQLFFLLGALAARLVYLSKGLALILAFIGVKLILEAAHGVHWTHIGSFDLPHIGTNLSLIVIVSVLSVTAAASVLKTRRTGE